MDLRVWNHVQNVWQPTGQYLWAQISNAGPTCVTLAVPAAYQNYYTTAIVDFMYTQNNTTLAWKGWSAQYALPGTLAYTQNNAITKFSNVTSIDNLGIHYEYWH